VGSVYCGLRFADIAHMLTHTHVYTQQTHYALAVRVYEYDWGISSVWVHIAYMYDIESNSKFA
jgi:hypothetical protein